MATMASAMMTIAWPEGRRRLLLSTSVLRPHRRPRRHDESGPRQLGEHPGHWRKEIGHSHRHLRIARRPVWRDPDVAGVGRHYGDGRGAGRGGGGAALGLP